jgi:hypothetical protein
VTTEELKEMVLKARNEGKVVMWVLPDQLMTAPVEEFVKQPADGILWDLNRGEECALSSTDSIRWVNDFAVAVTIRELVKQRDTAIAAVSTRAAQEEKA